MIIVLCKLCGSKIVILVKMTTVLTRCRVSSEQLNLLLSFMEEHRDFAAGKQSIYSRYSASKLWRLLAERLNAAAAESGGVRKSPDKWCRYWADIKYKARKKAAAGGTMGDLSTVEERLQNILDAKHKPCCGGCSQTDSQLDEDGKSAPIDDDMYSEGSGTGTGDAQRLTTEELLAEAAMRGALAAERQAESVTKGVQLLRELVELVRASLMPHPTLASHPPPAPHPPHAPHAPHAPHLAPPDNTLTLHHHHRL